MYRYARIIVGRQSDRTLPYLVYKIQFNLNAYVSVEI